jgi:hypothetical protein
VIRKDPKPREDRTENSTQNPGDDHRTT